MFKRFEAPFLERGCARVDHSYFHLDGHECLGILDSLLEIPRLGAIEWTPSPNRPHGASPCYDAMIQRIRQAGKSVILIEIPPEAVIPLFDRIGAHGLYIHTDLKDPRTAEALLAAVDRYR
jgi:5-methyltetrahydrofolate--homocysteine methyltransferase